MLHDGEYQRLGLGRKRLALVTSAQKMELCTECRGQTLFSGIQFFDGGRQASAFRGAFCRGSNKTYKPENRV